MISCAPSITHRDIHQKSKEMQRIAGVSVLQQNVIVRVLAFSTFPKILETNSEFCDSAS